MGGDSPASGFTAEVEASSEPEPYLIKSTSRTCVGRSHQLAFHRILSGETNVKGYLLMQFLYAQIVGPLKGRNKELGAETYKSTTKPDRLCVAVLKHRMLSKLDQEHGLELVSLGTPLESGNDEFIGSSDLFALGEPKSMDGLSYDVIMGLL
ncbi:hypothetical protein ASPFODRAFT_206169 [Aspergillus luchuensis CBS 106.47]|uniref:Uncharacterized protein n=1 Tax=Aspergillus luchuensis (strain CBS 106.47) TaxID=1137211 RepID=A0A1M3TKZ1_ASPLC|nr:hypothetical protein ASPFODRAFT_206169 [Aspergillus luchuensis CBS 106.47]